MTHTAHTPRSDTLDRVIHSLVQGLAFARAEVNAANATAILPVDEIRVAPAPWAGPRAWQADYRIAVAEIPDPARTPPLTRFAITRFERADDRVTDGAITALGLELDALAQDRSVRWTQHSVVERGVGLAYSLESSVGISGTPSDRLRVELMLDERFRLAITGPLHPALGTIYRWLDFSETVIVPSAGV